MMRHVERLQADDVAQTGDDKDCTGVWDTAEEARARARGGGGGYWNETDGTAGVRWIGEKQKEVTDSHLARGRVNRASNNGMVLTSGDESGVTRVI